MMRLPSHLPVERLKPAFRALRLLDLPDMIRHVNFAKLRRRYYDLYWATMAQEAGVSFRKWDAGFARLEKNGVVLIVNGPDIRLDDHLTLKLMGNKALTYELMSEQGFAVPRHLRFDIASLGKAEAFLAERGRPVVVKPNSGTGGGRGVTTGITTAKDLRRAAYAACRFDPELIVESQLDGQCWRLLFIDGVFLDAVRRDPPSITGDGMRTIRALVAEENANRLAANPVAARPFTALSPIRLDREAKLYLAAQGLGPSSVPPAGETVIVKRAINENHRRQNHSLPHAVHPATLAQCARLAQNLGVRLAGFDIIARDIGAPLGPGNGLIGEINTTPGLHHHDLVAELPVGTSVGARLVAHMFDTGAGTMTIGLPPRPMLRIASA
jgi:D-alanine-D-alanine ligase-like ATP-grasp enzyme